MTQQVGAENLVVKRVADTQAQKLEASNAPETAKAIQQVAARSNTGATVSAAEFLAQAKAQVADQAAAAAEAAAKAAPAAEASAAAPGAVQPGEFAQPGYTAAAPAPAPGSSHSSGQAHHRRKQPLLRRWSWGVRFLPVQHVRKPCALRMPRWAPTRWLRRRVAGWTKPVRGAL